MLLRPDCQASLPQILYRFLHRLRLYVRHGCACSSCGTAFCGVSRRNGSPWRNGVA
jgi:hypothetical protein